ncbi:MAG TPA: hypothetical protein VHM69_05330 [Rubrobacter sp.]|nr:hypothetical protein [Rubrobacter sp.]
MTTASFVKWPTPFQVKRVSNSVLGKELSFFFVSGVLRPGQYEELKRVIPVLAVHEVEDKLIVSTLITQEKCEELYREFEPLSRRWRNQYYVLANEIVRERRKALED